MVLTQFVFRFPCFRVSVFNSAFFHWLFEFSLLSFWVYSGAFLQVLITGKTRSSASSFLKPLHV